MQDGVIFWNQSKVQSDDQNRENPENIPGLSKIFIFYHFFDGMGGWIPYEKDEKNAEKIIQDSKSRKTRKMQGVQNQKFNIAEAALERLLKQEKTAQTAR